LSIIKREKNLEDVPKLQAHKKGFLSTTKHEEKPEDVPTKTFLAIIEIFHVTKVYIKKRFL
jgi:hypothetical protein